MNKKVAILQSNYIPWKGYFDLINSVDEFVIYDDMQYTRRDWRNRNKIKTPNGLQWLTIPVEVKGKYYQKINETIVSDKEWAKKHWETIKNNYSKAKCFKEFKDVFEEFYLKCDEEYLSKINYSLIKIICEIIGINTKLRWSSEFNLVEGQTEKLLEICKQCNSNIYISGPSAKDYFDETLAKKDNIEVIWMDYSNYPEYTQLFPPFEHGVSILDMIFNMGSDTKKYMKSFSG
jgi:hypothetical protein